MPFRQRAAPGTDLVGAQVDEPHITDRHRRLREQPAQLLDPGRPRLVPLQVLRDQLGKRYLPTWTQPLELSPKRPFRVYACRESAHLRPSRAAAVDAVAIRPQRLSVRATRPELQNLTMLCYRGTSLDQ